jgi:CRP-like cAMP-binding protein
MLGTDVFAETLASSRPGSAEEARQAIAELGSIATTTSCKQEQHCDNGGGPITGWVEAGMIRKYVVHANGQRRIIDLLMPGDFFGLFDEAELDSSLQAVAEGTRVARCSRRRLFALAGRNRIVGQLLQERAHHAIARLESHLLVQGRTRAPEKVGAYLLCLAKRLGSPAADIDLPITRYDIADHLGIAVETVCRAITDLRHAGAINLNSPRRISILDVQMFHLDG